MPGKLCSRWRLITNVHYADAVRTGLRLWCEAVLIDLEPSEHWEGEFQWQVRGLAWGGRPAFTLYVKGDDPRGVDADGTNRRISLRPHEGGAWQLMSNDGNFYNLDSGLVLSVGDEPWLHVVRQDYHQPIRVEEVDRVPWGDDLDRRLFPFVQGQGYPKTRMELVPDLKGGRPMKSERELEELVSGGPLPGTYWRHYKGGNYIVVASALVEATLEPVVVYKRAGGSMITFTRPRSEWGERVEGRNGVMVPRFRPLDFPTNDPGDVS